VAEKTRLTNAGKKEQRQIEQILNKAVKEGTYQADGAARDVESRTVPKGHSMKAKGGK
jgi:hypothetical protein